MAHLNENYINEDPANQQSDNFGFQTNEVAEYLF
jgi:hypothetical protein